MAIPFLSGPWRSSRCQGVGRHTAVLPQPGANTAGCFQNGARDDLIDSHLGLARALARRFSHRGELTDDLIQVAMVGLVKAASRYDESANTKFCTYATVTIMGELKR